MTRCLLEKCCCCIDLSTGCLIIGYVHLIVAILSIIWPAALLARNRVFIGSTTVDSTVVIFSVIVIIIQVVMVIMSVLLLVGVYNDQSGFVKLFFVFLPIYIVLNIITYFPVYATIFIIDICALIIGTALNIYFFFVVRSYYYYM